MTNVVVADVLARARDALASQRLDDADGLLIDALGSALMHPELLYMRGVVASRRGAHDAAIAHLQQALAVAPTLTVALLALGHACARVGDWNAAVRAYADATAQQPAWADAFFNLGLARRKLGDAHGAAVAFLRAWRLAPEFKEAGSGCVATLAAWARSTEPMPAPPVCRLPEQPPSISVVVCSIDDAKAQAIMTTYERVLEGLPHDVVVLRDARSLAEAYNRGVAAARGEIVILSHDDIELRAGDFAARLVSHLRTCDVVGPIGGTRMTGPVPIWAGQPHVRGWITHHRAGAAEWQVDLLHPLPFATGVVVLDGVLLAARREVFVRVSFDAAAFDGFHGYDVDWSYRAAQAGYRLAAAGDLRVVHASGGRYDATWERYAERFCGKHGTGTAPAAPPPFRSVPLASGQEVTRFFDALLALAADDLRGHPEVSTVGAAAGADS